MELVQEKYIQTEVGLIPSDWEMKRLGDLGKFSKGSGVRKDQALSGDIPCIRYGEIYTRHNDYIKQFYSFISKDISETAKKIKFGDILFAGSGETKEEIGKSVAFIDNFEAYAGGDIVILSTINVEPLYLGYLLNVPIIQNQKASKGQGDAVVHISSSQLENISIPLPSTIEEQTIIATALSDADNWINSLGQLIAKKQLIKQGALRELLQPNESWKIVNLSQNFTLKARIGWQGLTTAEYLKSGDYGLVTGTDFKKGFIDWDNCVFVEKIRFDQDKNIQLKEKDVLVTKDGTIGKVAFIDHLPKPTTLNSGVFVVRPKNDFNNQFLYYILMSFYFDKFLEKITAGSTIVHLYQKDFMHFNFPAPSLLEQTRIANILSDMDVEITALEQKLEKAKEVKLGMMQELLTGRIRLI